MTDSEEAASLVARLSLAGLVLVACAGCAAARPASCLVEVGGKALISGPCEFVNLDPAGSFKVSVAEGAEAEVRVAGKDAKALVRASPQGEPTDLGAFLQDGGCWDPLGDPEANTKICAFAGAGFDVEPDPKFDDSAIIYWGSRIGMFDAIDKRQGLDTAHARIVTAASRDGAIVFCREYSHDYTQACIAKALAARPPQQLTADCPRKRFTGFNGWRVAYVGPNHGDPAVMPLTKYLFRDVASGKLLDGSEASSYPIAEGIYAALCPKTAPRPED